MTRRLGYMVGFAIGCLGATPLAAETADAAVKAALARYAQNVKAMDAAAIAASFTPDGELLEPNMQPLRGTAAIRDFLASFTGVRIESTTMTAESTQVWGAGALQWGTYTQRVVVGDKPAADYAGRFAAQWSRDASGKWRIRRLMMQPGAASAAPAEPNMQAIALTPPDVRWFTPANYTDGRQRAHLLGDSSKGGDWIDRVRIPGGSRVAAHTHADDEIDTVLEGTWYLGIGERFDEAKLTAYPAGSFIVIPANVPHFVATKEGPVVVQSSGHGIFQTSYVKQ